MMLRQPLAEIRLVYCTPEPLLGLFWVSLLLLLSLGCTQPQVKTQVPVGEISKQQARVFPEFVAVIAQPGDTFSSLAKNYLDDSSKDWVISEFNGVNVIHPGQELIIPLRPYRRGGLTFAGYQKVPVLCYHKFSETEKDQMTVKRRAFEQQMSFLKENGYSVITLDELFDFLDFRYQLPRKSVVITIDDGWRSTYDTAFPILKRYGFPATLFIYTDLIVGSSKTLNWDLIREMSQNGIDMQCHTKTHRNLTARRGYESFQEYFRALQEELLESNMIIMQELSKEVRYLAYPYGGTNDLIVSLVKKLGYKGAFTVERGSNPFFVDRYRIHRSMIYGDFDLQAFEKDLETFSRFRLQ